MKKPLLIILAVLVSAVVFGAGGYYLGTKNTKKNLSSANITPDDIVVITPVPAEIPSVTPAANLRQLKFTGKITVPTIIVYSREQMPESIFNIVANDTNHRNSIASLAAYINGQASKSGADLKLTFDVKSKQTKIDDNAVTISNNKGRILDTDLIEKKIADTYPDIANDQVWQVLIYGEATPDPSNGGCATYGNSTDLGAGTNNRYYTYKNHKIFYTTVYEHYFGQGPEGCTYPGFDVFDKSWVWERSIRNLLSIYGAHDVVLPYATNIAQGEAKCSRGPKNDVMCGYYVPKNDSQETGIIEYQDRIFSEQTQKELGWK